MKNAKFIITSRHWEVYFSQIDWHKIVFNLQIHLADKIYHDHDYRIALTVIYWGIAITYKP